MGLESPEPGPSRLFQYLQADEEEAEEEALGTEVGEDGLMALKELDQPDGLEITIPAVAQRSERLPLTISDSC